MSKKKPRVLKTKLLLHKRQTRRAGLSALPELLVKIFHQQIQLETCNEIIITIHDTTSQSRRYTTLLNVRVKKTNDTVKNVLFNNIF